MFRKTICILLAVLFCIGAAGCAKADPQQRTVGVEQLQKDVAESRDWRAYGAEIVSFSETKRQTNPDDKTDYVFVKVVGENDEYRVTAYYKLTYVLYNEGWLLEELIPDPKETPIVIPKASETPVTDVGTAEPFPIVTPEPVPSEATAAPIPTPDLDAQHAEIQRYPDNGNEMIAITAVIPANATLTIAFPHQSDYTFENTEAQEITRKVRIPVAVFYPNEPLTESELEYTPEITITNADGSTYQLDCPSFTMQFPVLQLAVTAPLPDANGVCMADESNVVLITGTVSDSWADVTVNGELVTVYEGGTFQYEYRFPEDVQPDAAKTFRIVASKNNCVTAVRELLIYPYPFIPGQVRLSLKTGDAILLADRTGKVTVTGKTTPGARLSAASDNETNVLCGSVTVDDDGNFSVPITMDDAFYGYSVITLKSELEDVESAEIRFRVAKGFLDKEAFIKYYNTKKQYVEITEKKAKISELLANQSVYATSEYGFRLTATVVEVISKDGDVIVKMELNKTGEIVYVHNLSERWIPSDNIGGKYNIYCSFVGTYEDTGCCEFLCWFAKKP